jgi:hypothetical protein
MTVEQCARELANLLQSGQPPSPQQVNALIDSCLRGCRTIIDRAGYVRQVRAQPGSSSKARLRRHNGLSPVPPDRCERLDPDPAYPSPVGVSHHQNTAPKSQPPNPGREISTRPVSKRLRVRKSLLPKRSRATPRMCRKVGGNRTSTKESSHSNINYLVAGWDARIRTWEWRNWSEPDMRARALE